MCCAGSLIHILAFTEPVPESANLKTVNCALGTVLSKIYIFCVSCVEAFASPRVECPTNPCLSLGQRSPCSQQTLCCQHVSASASAPEPVPHGLHIPKIPQSGSLQSQTSVDSTLPGIHPMARVKCLPRKMKKADRTNGKSAKRDGKGKSLWGIVCEAGHKE